MKFENSKDKKTSTKNKRGKGTKTLIPKKFLFKPSQRFKFKSKTKGNKNILKDHANISNKSNSKNKKWFNTKRKSKKRAKIKLNKSRIIFNKKSRLFFLLFNSISLLINSLFLINILISHRQSNKLFFKISDSFNFNIFKKSYQEISAYLNNKFSTNYFNGNNSTKNKNNNVTQSKKQIRVKSVGLFNREAHQKWLRDCLDDEFEIKFTKKNPDYLIYNVFNSQDRTEYHPNEIRIAVYTENKMVDMNYADYTIAHYHINYLDKYFKHNVFFWENFTDIDKVRKEVLKNPIRTKFCGAVISNCTAEFRLKFIDKLNKYKTVDMGGKCWNNIKRRVGNKTKFLRNYKFTIAMENSDGDGYVTEKIIQAFLAGNIPIYYGDYLVEEFINPKTFILIKGEKDIDAKIEYIKKIDNDDKLYRRIMKEKPLIDDKFLDKIEGKEIKDFLKNIFRQDKEKAFRRDKSFYDYDNNCIYNK